MFLQQRMDLESRFEAQQAANLTFVQRSGAICLDRNRFERLYLVGAPRFLGLMRKVLSKQAHQMVADEIPKDVSRCDAREIEQVVRESTERATL